MESELAAPKIAEQPPLRYGCPNHITMAQYFLPERSEYIKNSRIFSLNKK
jgi:hypothetical protein